MTAELATRSNGGAAGDFTDSQLDLIKRTIAKGATDDELNLFLYTAKARGLDPLLRQVHAVKRWDKEAERQTMAIQVGIDGYRLLADRTGAYAGNDEPEFGGHDPDGRPGWARVTVWRIVQGQRCAFTARALWAEYYPGDKQGFMWRKMPHTMLAKCAEALALRKAFPAETSGLYIPEEMHQAGTVVEGSATDASPEYVREMEAPAKARNEPPADADPGSSLEAAWNEWRALAAELDARGITHGHPTKGTTPEQLRQGIDRYRPALNAQLARERSEAQQRPVTASG